VAACGGGVDEVLALSLKYGAGAEVSTETPKYAPDDVRCEREVRPPDCSWEEGLYWKR
jgi:hypothetical protein